MRDIVESEAPAEPVEHIADISGAVMLAEGFHRVKWDLVFRALAAGHPPERHGAVLQEMLLQWLNIVRDDLGGDYTVYRSERFLILCDTGSDTAKLFAGFGEKVERAILAALGEVAWGSWQGTKVLLLFSDDDDYYQYLAFFYGEGIHSLSAGVHINLGYPHVAICLGETTAGLRVLAHELTHSGLCHLPLPIWLNEGVTVTLEKAAEAWLPASGPNLANQLWADATGWRAPVIWTEIAEQHHAFWNEERMQGFWAGTTFDEPGDPAQLSYHLAELLVNMLAKDRERFLGYLTRAHFEDAGQAAARECLGVDLGEVVGSFLGEGHWQPQPEAIKNLWLKKRQGQEAGEGLLPGGQ